MYLWKWKSLSRVRLFASPWTVIVHGLNSPGQNTEMGSCSLLQGTLSNPGIEPGSSALQADSLPSEPQGKLMDTFLRKLLTETSDLLSDPGWGLSPHCMSKWRFRIVDSCWCVWYPCDFLILKMTWHLERYLHVSGLHPFCPLLSWVLQVQSW